MKPNKKQVNRRSPVHSFTEGEALSLVTVLVPTFGRLDSQGLGVEGRGNVALLRVLNRPLLGVGVGVDWVVLGKRAGGLDDVSHGWVCVGLGWVGGRLDGVAEFGEEEQEPAFNDDSISVRTGRAVSVLGHHLVENGGVLCTEVEEVGLNGVGFGGHGRGCVWVWVGWLSLGAI